VIVSEITLLKQIDHPNIIKLKEIIVSRPNKRNLFRGSTFLVFEYMDHDFAGLFKMKCKFSLPEIKCIVSQLLEGVAYLHRNKIFHRDIKSANILLNDQGEVKLADFGLGRKIRF
jgi:cyclin-dependent kinase 12/13